MNKYKKIFNLENVRFYIGRQIRDIFSQCHFLPDFEALEETVRILRLVGLLTDDGPEPPGIVDH